MDTELGRQPWFPGPPALLVTAVAALVSSLLAAQAALKMPGQEKCLTCSQAGFGVGVMLLL